MTKKQMGMLGAKIIALSIVLMIVMAIGAQFIPTFPDAAGGAGAGTGDPSAGSSTLLPAMLIILQTVALAYLVVRSRWFGWRLLATVFVLFFGTFTVLSQIESIIYLNDKMQTGMQFGIFLMGLFAAAVFSPILVLALDKWKRNPASESEISTPTEARRSWRWTLPLGGAIYLAFYYLFGYYVAWQIPEVREYYQGIDPGSFLAQMQSIVRHTPWMVPVQFLRGLGWALLALLAVRMMRGPWWEAGLALALLFTIPSLYLLLPNPIMPEVIRMAHLMETVPCQFIYGWLMAFVFGWRPNIVG